MINPSSPRSRTLGLLLAATTLAAACSEPIDEAATDTSPTQPAADTQPAEAPADEDAGETETTDETTAEPSDEAEPADRSHHRTPRRPSLRRLRPARSRPGPTLRG